MLYSEKVIKKPRKLVKEKNMVYNYRRYTETIE